jgi:S1-C subfamily serine protease
MANKKILISILVIFLLIIGGLSYYSYSLNRQLDRLDQKLTVLDTEQANRINKLSHEISGFMEETLSSYQNLEGKLEQTGSEIDDLSEQITAADTRIAGVEGKTGALQSDITDLAGRIEDTTKDLSGSFINAGDVFETVSRVTVRITNGQSVIGSGFIYTTDGYVLTAYHVVQDLSQIYVIMDDGKVSKAVVTGFSQPSDVAVLKLQDSQLTGPTLIGNSSIVKIGEPVVTIGSPGDSSQALGLRDTLTAGVVSQVNRYVNVDDNWVANMIQFDAAVNFGNSGGPLANSRGEIIGLITARIDPTLGDGIYYAVSSNKFKRVADAIIVNGSFAYPWIGVGVLNLSPQGVLEKSLETINGVLVSEVFAGSPAQAAGIRLGDIILSMDDISVKDIDELVSYLGEFKSPGQEITVTIIRGSVKMEITVEVGTRPQ